jgi:hypothetical protein
MVPDIYALNRRRRKEVEGWALGSGIYHHELQPSFRSLAHAWSVFIPQRLILVAYGVRATA